MSIPDFFAKVLDNRDAAMEIVVKQKNQIVTPGEMLERYHNFSKYEVTTAFNSLDIHEPSRTKPFTPDIINKVDCTEWQARQVSRKLGRAGAVFSQKPSRSRKQSQVADDIAKAVEGIGSQDLFEGWRKSDELEDG